MRDFFVGFFKNKVNVALFVVQCVALSFFALGNLLEIFYVFAILAEGVFFIWLGIKMFRNNGKILSKQDLLESLPLSKSEMQEVEKSNKKTIRVNRLQAWLFIFMGIIMFFIVIF